MGEKSSNSFGCFVAGTFRATANTRDVRSPYDGRVVATVCDAGPDEIEAALAAAKDAFAKTRALRSDERSAICKEIAAGIKKRRDELSLSICDEAGKPISDAQAEVDRAIFCFELASAEAERTAVEGQLLPMDLQPQGAGRLGLCRRFPIGPIAAISPFNFPLNLAVHKIAPAMAAGCPVVLKPASQTPTPTLRLAEIIAETAWPKGALSVMPATRGAADLLVTDERCKLLTFTGSAPVGWDMKARAGKKRVVLELGGNAAVIIDETVTEKDLEALCKKLCYGAFSHAGQKCISVQRIYVVAENERFYSQFRDRFVAAAKAVKAGDPREKDVIVGPMIDEHNARRVESWIEEARQAGAKILCSGERKQALVPATVIEAAPPETKVICEEIFGPVCAIDRVKSFDAAIAAVNDSKFGLQAAVWTRDLGHSLRAFLELEVGAVVLNEAPSFRIDHMPYGGVKDSGFGREGIRDAIQDMTEPRLLITGTLQ